MSVGGLTERLVRFAGESLYHELRKFDNQQLVDFSNTVLSIFEKYLKVSLETSVANLVSEILDLVSPKDFGMT